MAVVFRNSYITYSTADRLDCEACSFIDMYRLLNFKEILPLPFSRCGADAHECIAINKEKRSIRRVPQTVRGESKRAKICRCGR